MYVRYGGRRAKQDRKNISYLVSDQLWREQRGGGAGMPRSASGGRSLRPHLHVERVTCRKALREGGRGARRGLRAPVGRPARGALRQYGQGGCRSSHARARSFAIRLAAVKLGNVRASLDRSARAPPSS